MSTEAFVPPTCSPSNASYTVGWVCALSTEYLAAQLCLDQEHGGPEYVSPHDNNDYTLGRVGKHNVVIAVLPDGEYGTSSAASVARDMLHSFPNVRIGLMVGIGGGAPTLSNDVRLGDIVISTPRDGEGGVMQYDFGKTIQDQAFQRTAFLNRPPTVLLTAVNGLKAQYRIKRRQLEEAINLIILGQEEDLREELDRPPASSDRLYRSDFVHPPGKKSDCMESCGIDSSNLVTRVERGRPQSPVVHYGLIASANQLMKDALVRDKLATEHDVLCFEMEAAGLMNHFPCLVIRGICDYSDSHKNKKWQSYAAVAAAAYAKALLHRIPPSKVEFEETINSKLSSIDGGIQTLGITTDRLKAEADSAKEQEVRDWFFTTQISHNYHKSLLDRTPGTGQWLLGSEIYTCWKDNTAGLLWLYGAAGSGKTVLCSTVIQDVCIHVQNGVDMKAAYWYFRFNDTTTQNIHNMVRSFIRQLAPSPVPASAQELWEAHNKRGTDPSLEELTVVLDEIIDVSTKVFIIMDALDECQQSSECQERRLLLKYIATRLREHKEKIHILVTSRVEHDIKCALEHYRSINIQKLVDSDVRMYIQQQICSGVLAKYEGGVKGKIEDCLLSPREKRFRWVDLQIRRLSDCNTEHQINHALETIPESLEELYKETIGKIPAKDGKLAREILMWLCFSFRPITLSEVAEAVGLIRPEKALQICSSMLITLIHEDTDEVIQLAHFTVKEYLVMQEKGESDSLCHFTSESAQATLASTAIRCLLQVNTGSLPGIPTEKHLMGYSARFWYRHAAAVVEREKYDDVLELVDCLFSPEYSTSYKNWLWTYDCDDPFKRGPQEQYPQPLYYASLLGLHKSARKLLCKGAVIKEEGRCGSALLAATIKGRVAIVEAILDKTTELTEAQFCTAIRHIQRNSRAITAAYVRKYKSDITEQLIHTVVMSSRSIEDFMAVVLERKGNNTNFTQGAVAEAARRLDAKFMARLLEQGQENVKITEAVLIAAAENRLCGENVVTLLLDRRGDDTQIKEALLIAAAENRVCGKGIMALLLERKGEDIKVTEAVLTAAAENWACGRDIMTLLLDQGDQDAEITQAALVAVAVSRACHIDNVTALLRRREDAKITEAALIAATENRLCGRDMMNLLLERKEGITGITEAVVSPEAVKPRACTPPVRSQLNGLTIEDATLAKNAIHLRTSPDMDEELFGGLFDWALYYESTQEPEPSHFSGRRGPELLSKLKTQLSHTTLDIGTLAINQLDADLYGMENQSGSGNARKRRSSNIRDIDKRPRRLVDPSETAHIRRSVACVPCRVSKIRCNDSGVCPTCRKAFPDHSHLVCIRMTPSMAWPVMAKVPDFWSCFTGEENYLCNGPCSVTGNPSELAILFGVSRNSPSLYVTVQACRSTESPEGTSVPRTSVFQLAKLPGYSALEKWAEDQIQRESGPEIGLVLQNFLRVYSREGLRNLPKQDLVRSVHKMNCIFRIWKKPVFLCIDPSKKLVPLPISVQAQLRSIAKKALEVLEHDVLKMLDECLAQQGSPKAEERVGIWVSMWQLMLMYRELLIAYKSHLGQAMQDPSAPDGSIRHRTQQYQRLIDSFYPLLSMLYHYQFRTKKSIELSLDWLDDISSSCVPREDKRQIHYFGQQLLASRPALYNFVESSAQKDEIDNMLWTFVVAHELKKLNARTRPSSKSRKSRNVDDDFDYE